MLICESMFFTARFARDADMEKRWYEISFLVPDPWTEILPAFLQERGFSSLWIDSEKRPPFRSIMRAYILEQAWTSSLEKQLHGCLKEVSSLFSEQSEEAEIQKRVIREEDWASKWLPFFKPLKIGPVWIRPSTKTVELANGEREIVLDPGQAFGTGHHETTQLCLESMLRLRSSLEANASILDLGTGSGILAMFAATLGFKDILALDVDPVAVETARQNVSANRLSPFVEVDGVPLGSVEKRFALILANLSAPVFNIVCYQVTAHVETQGWLVVSGILADESNGVKRLWTSRGLDLVDETSKNEWVCMVFKRAEEVFT